MTKPFALLAATFALLASTALALPQGMTVTSGGSTAVQGSTNLSINQSTNSAVLNWQSFNVGAGEAVQFNQPNASSLSINRISGAASQIDGTISANGRVWLLNPNGVMFGSGARVNVGGLVATTASDADTNGNFTGISGGGSVINNGLITAQQYAALAAATVQNNGTITAPNATLAGAARFALDESGVVSLSPGMADFAARVANTGSVQSYGGNASLLTQAGLAGVVNNSGLVEASGVQTNGGTIRLTGDTIYQSGNLRANGGTNGNGGRVEVLADTFTGMGGTIQAKGGSQSGNGGFVEVSSKQGMKLTGSVDTTAAHGKTGMLLIDPNNIIITDGGPDADDAQVADGTINQTDNSGGDFSISEQSLEALAAGNNILLQATNNITINPLTDHVLGLATTGSVSFQADADNSGVGAFSMNAADSITTGGGSLSITGATLSLGALSGGAITLGTTGGSGNITLNRNLTAAGNVALTGNMLLPADVTIAATNSNIALNGDVTGAHILTLNAGSGALTLGNLDVGQLNATAAATTLGGTLTSDQALDLTTAGPLSLSADTTLNATNGVTRQNITLGAANTVNGAHALTLTGNNIALGAAIGGSSPLTSVNADAAGTLAMANVTTSGNQTYTGATGLTLGGNLTTAGGDITVNNAATLGNDATLATSGGNITLASTVDGAHNFAANAGAGNVSVGGAVGGTTRLTTFAATGAGLTLNGVKTTGAQTYTGPASIQGTFSNNTGAATFNNAVTLAGNTTFNNTATAGNIAFNSTVDGPHTLAVTTGSGAATFGADVGTGTPLTSFSASGNTTVANVATSGAQSYSGATGMNGTYTGSTLNVAGATTLTGNANLTGTGDITVGGTFTGAHNLTLNTPADIYMSSLNVPQLVLAGGNNVFINGNLTTTAGLDFTNTGAITLQSNSTWNAGTALTTTAGNAIDAATHSLTLNGTTLNLHALTTGGNLTLNGTAIALNGNIAATAITANAPTSLGANLTTTGGNITLNHPVTLTGNSAIASNNGNITVHGAVDGPHSLTLNAGTGTITADTDWGGLTPLASLDATGQVVTLQNLTTTGNLTLTGSVISNQQLNAGSNLTVNGPIALGGNLSAGNTLTLTGLLTLTADSQLFSGGGVGNNIAVTGDVTGQHNLQFIAGSGDILLSGNLDVGSLTFTSGNQLTYNGGTIHTTSQFLFGNIPTIYLVGDTVLHAGPGATGRADITAANANTVLASAPGVDLTIYGDTVTLHQIGDTGAGRLQSLYINANTVQLLGDIHTIGAQTINATQGLAGLLVSNGGDITLNTASTLLTDVTVQSGGGNVYFNQPISGAHNLSVDAGTGTVYINATLGQGAPLTSFIANGQRVVLAGDLYTTGLTLNVPTTLAANSTLATGQGALVLNGRIEGVHTLTLNTEGGDILLNQGGSVGNYVQQSGAGKVVWGGTGLTVAGDVTSIHNGSMQGTLTTGGIATLDAAHGSNLALNVGSLGYSGGPGVFTGSIGGQTGRAALRNVQLGHITAGRLAFNDMPLPPLETYLPQLPNLTAKSIAPASLYTVNDALNHTPALE